MNNQDSPSQNFLFYTADSGNVSVQVVLDDNNETIWATQKSISDIFGTTTQNITTHLKNIYKEEELEFEATCKEILQVQKEGNRYVKRKSLLYNLDAIIAVGYRINSNKFPGTKRSDSRRLRYSERSGHYQHTINKQLRYMAIAWSEILTD